MLVQKGLKNTRQRNAVLEVMKDSHAPLTADDIYLRLKEKNIATCLSTVYRTLETLCSKDLVTKSNLLDDNKSKYELACKEHRHHLICLSCTKIIHIEDCPLKELEMSLHNKTDFEVTGHKLEIYGYCPACKK